LRHRVEADGPEIYESLLVPPAGAAGRPPHSNRSGSGNGTSVRAAAARQLSLQRADVTRALKQMLDALNERPIYRKTTTIQPFVRAIERAYQAAINRNQQDAQEFLQIVLERIHEEYEAVERVRREARRRGLLPRGMRGEQGLRRRRPPAADKPDEAVAMTVAETIAVDEGVTRVVSPGGAVLEQPPSDITSTATATSSSSSAPSSDSESPPSSSSLRSDQATTSSSDHDGGGGGEDDHDNDVGPDPAQLEPTSPAAIPFPFAGQLTSQVECRACGYRPKPTTTGFVTLTLQIPQDKGTATLASCLDTLLMTEYIEGYRCDRCALVHALEARQAQIHKLRSRGRSTPASTSTAADPLAQLNDEVRRIEHALATDPETPPPGLDVVSPSTPKRTIARTTRIVSYPRVLAIHLSRSLFGGSYASSTKNAAKVAFPETLRLGRRVLAGDGQERRYRLVSIVCHKGSSHNSGHYECMRRCVVREPVGTKVNEEVWRWVGSRSRSRVDGHAAAATAAVDRTGDDNAGEGGQEGGGPPGSDTEAGHPIQQTRSDKGKDGRSRCEGHELADASALGESQWVSIEHPSPSRGAAANVTGDSESGGGSGAGNGDGDGNGLETARMPQSHGEPNSTQVGHAAPAVTGTLAGTRHSDKETTDTESAQCNDHDPRHDTRHQHQHEDRAIYRVTSRLRQKASRTSFAGMSMRSRASKGREEETNGDEGPQLAKKSTARSARSAKAAARKRLGRTKSRSRNSNTWFRVSDEKVKQCKTSDVLAMQKDVYLLFYELDEDCDGGSEVSGKAQSH
ncbi:hypothetical protein KEM52_000917, partial [Ascosphaera acerosa]